MRWFLAVMPALLAGWLWMPVAILAAEPHRPADTDPAKADEDFRFQGEYVGTFVGSVDGKPLREVIGAQVVALGDGKFSGVGCRGGRSGRLLTDFASCTPDGPAYNGESIHEPD